VTSVAGGVAASSQPAATRASSEAKLLDQVVEGDLGVCPGLIRRRSYLEQEIEERGRIGHAGPQRHRMRASWSRHRDHEVVLARVACEDHLEGRDREVEPRDVVLADDRGQPAADLPWHFECLRRDP
jgi:hypothetical protein